MPPAIPLYSFDFKGKSKLVGVSETRSGQFYAEIDVSRKYIPPDDIAEFGNVVYGPPRNSATEAKKDYNLFCKAMQKGSYYLRCLIAKLAPLGGTRSHPSPTVIPLLSSRPLVSLSLGPGDSLIRGVRRKHVSLHGIPSEWPLLLLERVLDLLVDILSSVVDSQLGILPDVKDLEELIRFAISREKSVCPAVSEGIFRTSILPLIELFLQSDPWKAAHLHPIRSTSDDREVIQGFLSQFYDKARQADIFGEKKQLKRLKHEVRERKKFHHTVFVGNLPKDVSDDALFSLFDQGLYDDPSIGKVVYKVYIPREAQSGHTRGFGFVTCRSAKATAAVLEHSWKLGNIKLHVSRREDQIMDEPISLHPQPKRMKSEIIQLPESLQAEILKAVAKNPGCNISLIPSLIQKSENDGNSPLDPYQYGFRNLTQAIQSVKSLRLETSGDARPIYYAYPETK